MPSPASRYIEFLLLEGLDDARVTARVALLGLDAGDGAFVARRRAELATPTIFRPRNAKHVASRAFIASLGLTELFDNSAVAKHAMCILTDRRARELAETLLIAGAPESAIVRALGAAQPGVTAEAVLLFVRLFFDISAFTRGDLRVVLDLRAEREAAAAMLESPAAAAAVRRRHRFDPRRIAADLPQGAPFAHVALLAIGIDVPTAEPAVLLRRIRDRAVMRAVERVNGRSRRDAQTCVTLMELGLRATELIERVQDPQLGLVTQLQRVALRSADAKLPTIHELAGKNGFTVDLAPADVHESPDERLRTSG